jgi:hypothetical protein
MERDDEEEEEDVDVSASDVENTDSDWTVLVADECLSMLCAESQPLLSHCLRRCSAQSYMSTRPKYIGLEAKLQQHRVMLGRIMLAGSEQHCTLFSRAIRAPS